MIRFGSVIIYFYMPKTQQHPALKSYTLKQWIIGDIERDYVDLNTQDHVAVFVDFLQHMIMLKPSGCLVVKGYFNIRRWLLIC